jgi:hypothetical protein
MDICVVAYRCERNTHSIHHMDESSLQNSQSIDVHKFKSIAYCKEKNGKKFLVSLFASG